MTQTGSAPPFFSIGVPTYKRLKLLRLTLRSVLDQSFSDFEVIVGNDDPYQVLSPKVVGIEDHRIQYVNRPQNLGELGNMNDLLDRARGRYFTWLFDDDLLNPAMLESMYGAIKENGFPLCAFSSYAVVFGESFPRMPQYPRQRTCLYSGRTFLRMYLSGALKAMGCAGVFKTKWLQGVGGVESLSEGSIALYSEYLLLVRLGLLKEVLYNDAPLVLYRDHDGSWSPSNTEVERYKEAGINLVRESAQIFARAELAPDFQANMAAMIRFSARILVRKLIARDGRVRREEIEDYLQAVSVQVRGAKGLADWDDSSVNWLGVRKWLFWDFVRSRFKGMAPSVLLQTARRARSVWTLARYSLPRRGA